MSDAICSLALAGCHTITPSDSNNMTDNLPTPTKIQNQPVSRYRGANKEDKCKYIAYIRKHYNIIPVPHKLLRKAEIKTNIFTKEVSFACSLPVR